MSSKLQVTFLGTGAGWPLPRLGCNCEICASKDPKDRRSRPSLLLSIAPANEVSCYHDTYHGSKESLLIDPGPNVYQQLARLPKETVQNIGYCLITHAHQDHVLGLSDLDHIYNKQKRIKLVAPAPVFQDLKRNFLNLYRNLRRFEIIETESIRVGDYNIEFLPVPHSKAVSTYGISLRRENMHSSTLNTQHLTNLLLYIPDIARLKPEIVSLITRSRLSILDCSSWGKEGKTHTHISSEEIIQTFSHLKPACSPRRGFGEAGRQAGDGQKIYLTHLGHKSGRHSDLLAKLKPYPHIQPAFDGLEISI